jgi:hypothetical protein
MRTGSLSLSSNSPVSPGIALSGTGVVATANLSPAALSFASQIVGITSAAQSLNLSNSRGVLLQISSIAVMGDFSQTNNCGSTLAAGGALPFR